MSETGNALTDRTHDFIFSIDPVESTDFDDAISCQIFQECAEKTMFNKEVDDIYIGKPTDLVFIFQTLHYY